MEQKRYPSLDLLKVLCCIGVVFIHIEFPGITGEIVFNISRFAVPCFAMISGFLSVGKNIEVFKKRIIKLFKLFAIGLFFITSYTLIYNFYKNSLSEWFIENFNISSLIQTVFFSNIPFAVVLWYLLSMIFSYLLWILFIKNKKEQYLLKTTLWLFILQIITVLLSDYLMIPSYTKRFILIGTLPWFLLGYIIKKHDIANINNWVYNKLLYIVYFVSVILMICAAIFEKMTFVYSFVTITYSVSIFLIFLKLNIRSNKFINFFSNILSMYVYIFHESCNGIVFFIFNRTLSINVNSSLFNFCMPLITLFSTILLSFVFNLIMEKLHIKI